MLQCVAGMRYVAVLQRVAVHVALAGDIFCVASNLRNAVCCSVLQCVAMCCSVLQCVAVCCSVLQCVAVYVAFAGDIFCVPRNLRDTVCCSVAVCSSVLQCMPYEYLIYFAFPAITITAR